MLSMILFEFSGLSFVGMPRTVKFLSLYLLWIWIIWGISCLHGGHHEAQNTASTLLCFVKVVKIMGFVKGLFN